FERAATACIDGTTHSDPTALGDVVTYTKLGNAALADASAQSLAAITGTPVSTTSTTEESTTTTTEAYTKVDWLNDHKEAFDHFNDIFGALAVGLTDPPIVESDCNLFISFYDLVTGGHA